jgi:hypothetical protein
MVQPPINLRSVIDREKRKFANRHFHVAHPYWNRDLHKVA